MCYGCWTEAGKPTLNTPSVRAAAELVAKLYEHPNCASGGNLHIVTDDWNLEDSNLAFCLYCIEHGGQMQLDAGAPDVHQHYNEKKRANPDPPDQLAIERQCHDALVILTEEERHSALALEAGFWTLDVPPAEAAKERTS